MIDDFILTLSSNSTFAVLLAAGLGYYFYYRQKKIDQKFENKTKLIVSASNLLRECQNSLFLLDRINYTTEFVLKNHQIEKISQKEEFSQMVKIEIAELSKYINDRIPRAALDLENIFNIYFSSNSDVETQLTSLLGELKNWHDSFSKSGKLFDFSGKKAKEIFPIDVLSKNINSLVKLVSTQ